MKSRRYISENIIWRYIFQISSSIQYLHSKGIIHRDIKPSNILLFDNDILKITDFSLAINLATNIQEDSAGTPTFFSPEMLIHSSKNSFCDDMWAFGVVIYYLTYLSMPFEGNSIGEYYLNVLKRPPKNASCEYSMQLKSYISKFLEKDPLKRSSAIDAILFIPLNFKTTNMINYNEDSQIIDKEIALEKLNINSRIFNKKYSESQQQEVTNYPKGIIYKKKKSQHYILSYNNINSIPAVTIGNFKEHKVVNKQIKNLVPENTLCNFRIRSISNSKSYLPDLGLKEQINLDKRINQLKKYDSNRKFVSIDSSLIQLNPCNYHDLKRSNLQINNKIMLNPSNDLSNIIPGNLPKNFNVGINSIKKNNQKKFTLKDLKYI